MDSEDQKFQNFLAERSGILEDIKSFLDMVLSFCVNHEDKYGLNPEKITETKTAQSLMQSLCQMHGLYGYPANTSDNNTEVNQYAVEEMLKEIEQVTKKNETRTLQYYFKESAKKEFWDTEFSNETCSLQSLLREPAYVFLEMVRDLLPNGEKASVNGRLLLEGLPDGNILKPVVWAEHNSKECYGVSLGVRSFIRPLYLGIKLSQLKNVENADVKLEDVNSFQSMNRHSDDYKKTARSEYNKSKSPCESCQIFFGDEREKLEKKNETNFQYFGNCAEYDVIPTANSDDELRDVWKEFEDACNDHLTAYNQLAENLKKSANQSRDKMKTYYRKTFRAKVLKYKWESSRYKLILKNCTHGKKKKDNRTKRMKTQ